MPKVSFIVGIHNCADTLERSLNSIALQTFTDWELIICDDASEDNSLLIAKHFASKYPKKVVILKNSQNQGLNITLNKCLRIASGQYIARQDGDDISLPTRLAKQVSFLDSHPEFALVSTDMILFDDTGSWGYLSHKLKPKREDVIKGMCFSHGPCMIRRDVLNQIGGYTEEDWLLRCEDLNLWYKIYQAGFLGANIHEALYMAQDDFSASKRRTFQNRINVIRAEFDGMKRLNCTLIEYRFFIIKAAKSLLLAFMPEKMYSTLRKKKLSKKRMQDEEFSKHK